MGGNTKKLMNILIGCEFSGIVRDAFIVKGHNAVSCDILPTESPGPHIQDNILNHLNKGWDMLIAFPPCTYLTSVGNGWMSHPDDKELPFELRRDHPKFPRRREKRQEAYQFFLELWNSSIPKICIENPLGYINANIKADQIIHPWQFGHEASKRTCLWLKYLPKLIPTNIVDKGPFLVYKNGQKKSAFIHSLSPSKDRWKIRSKTFPGIAQAMADLWGTL